MSMDEFDRARETLWGAPGFAHKRSTLDTNVWALIPGGTWIVESIATDEGVGIFLQYISADGHKRISIPSRVAEVIYSHHAELAKKRRSIRSQRASETRKRKAAPQPGSKAD